MWVGFLSIHFLTALTEQVWRFAYLTTTTKKPFYIYLFQYLFIIYVTDNMWIAFNDL